MITKVNFGTGRSFFLACLVMCCFAYILRIDMYAAEKLAVEILAKAMEERKEKGGG